MREASSAIAEKAEKDMQTWIEGTLGMELQGSLPEFLRSGEVGCLLHPPLPPRPLPWSVA